VFVSILHLLISPSDLVFFQFSAMNFVSFVLVSVLARSVSRRYVKFMAENWKELSQRQKLGDVVLMVTSGERCFRLRKDDVTEITELRSMQGEADTRMMIHVKHAATS